MYDYIVCAIISSCILALQLRKSIYHSLKSSFIVRYEQTPGLSFILALEDSQYFSRYSTSCQISETVQLPFYHYFEICSSYINITA